MINTVIEFIFGAALFINALLFIPQAIRIFREKTAQSVSLTTFVGLLLIQFAIVLHGIIVHDSLLIWGYVISMVTTGLVVALTIKYRSHKVESDTSSLSFQEILMQLPGHIYWKDKNSVMLGCNANNFQDFGLKSLRDFIGKTDYDLFRKEEADCLRLTDEEVMRTGQTKIVEEEVTIANGEKVVYLSHKKPLRNNKNEIIGTIGTTVDIMAAKQEMVDRLYMLEGIIAAMPGNVYWMDKNGCYLGCNDNQARLIGLSSRQAIIGKRNVDIPGFLIPDTLDPVNQKIMETGETITLEEPAILSDGTEAVFISSKVPLRNSKKEITGLLGISIDITERKTMEGELKRAKKMAEVANKAKTEFVQNMQHDIRTPLASIMMLLNTIQKREISEEIREIFTLLEQVCDQLMNLCHNFAKASLNEAGEEPLKKQEVNIREIIKDSINIHRPTAENKNIELNLDISEDVPTNITSDEFRLRCIFLNLLGNAIKFTDEGKVILSVCMDKNNKGGVLLCMKVRDTGIGINKDKLPFIFDKYVRDDTGDSQKYPGTGLGLYFVKKYVEDLGGALRVDSELSKGSVFSINVPKSMCI